MKINRIKDFESFFKVVDKCKGRVDIVSPEGDNIVLNSQICFNCFGTVRGHFIRYS